jgi:hypothetical protein
MSKLDKYMNDPDIVNEPMPLREVHAIRLMIWDEIKDMTPEERAAYYNDNRDAATEPASKAHTVETSVIP